MPKRTINEYKNAKRKEVIFGSWEYMKIYHKNTVGMLGTNAFKIVARYALEYFNKTFPLNLSEKTAVDYIMSKIYESDPSYKPVIFSYDTNSIYDLAKFILEEDE